MQSQKKPQTQTGGLIDAHPLPVRPSRYRTVLDAARARDAAQPRSAPGTVLDYLKTKGVRHE